MEAHAIVDTGFLVALLNRRDQHHRWAVASLDHLRGPWVTADACVFETLFLLEWAGREARDRLLRWITRGTLMISQDLFGQSDAVIEVIHRFHDRWVDWADASLVVLSDLYPRLPVASIDVDDFAVYFRDRPARVLIMPAEPAS